MTLNNKQKIVILTGSEYRHIFFRKYIGLSKKIKIVKTYCEGLEKTLAKTVFDDHKNNELRLKHLSSREQSEKDFFKLFVDNTPDKSNAIHIKKGDINLDIHIEEIIKINPDIIIAYSCSIIKGRLLNNFKGRFLNVHLGLSPYYRGSGTNYWPLVNNEPEYVGVTFMHIDSGVDTGDIIHQIHADYYYGDSPSQIGNRLICKMTKVFKCIVENFNNIQDFERHRLYKVDAKIYKKIDYTEESVSLLYKNFENGMISAHLKNKEIKKVKIIKNRLIVSLCE
ncbi:formyltransferase family protein [Candidatus Thioglobus autotrophicus]|jgi:phosphoribosylglycinamide formyltransferase 1|uniref:formyltransferase family protein n=1 Tax=Candidatus Thioglobus autotrophicus TaxID=1705394 RepID=UPI00299DDD3C|nr:formyltransferase family protein [Candidatus Thioglobus autotrophicus]WPE15954.1 formyltransferase family protein [Candidatus Thioglobus autotrophicus]